MSLDVPNNLDAYDRIFAQNIRAIITNSQLFHDLEGAGAEEELLQAVEFDVTLMVHRFIEAQSVNILDQLTDDASLHSGTLLAMQQSDRQEEIKEAVLLDLDRSINRDINITEVTRRVDANRLAARRRRRRRL